MAFWRSADSANPDTEILNGLRPGMTTVPDALLLCISSSYARRGALWDAYRRHYGQDGDRILVWQADTRSMNPSVDEQVIAEAYAQDESAAAAEYGAQFRLLLLALPELVQLMIETAVSTGMRISEILGLKWGCVDLDRGLVWVRERYYRGDTDEPKSERSRRVLPLGYLVEAYRRRRARCPTLSGYVFEKDGEPMDDRALLKDEIRPAAKQLGIYFPGFGWRSFTWSGEKRQCSGCRNDYWEKEQARR